MAKEEQPEFLTPRQKQIVQATFQELLPQSELVGMLFYKRLFELEPGLRSMFNVEMHEQERKLIEMLQIAVYGFDHPGQLILALQRLGIRHLEYGVSAEQYSRVGQALLWTLEQAFEARLTAELKAAWEAAYLYLAQVMIDAAYKNDGD